MIAKMEPGSSSQLPSALTDPAELMKTYELYLSNRRTAGRDGLRPRNVEDRLGSLVSEISNKLLSGTYKFSPYREELRIKSADKNPRKISVPSLRDAIVLKAISVYISEYFNIKPETPQSKVGKIKSVFVSGSSAFDSFSKTDIVDFYPSIPHGILFEVLEKSVRSVPLVKLILSACRNPTLPISVGKEELGLAVNKGVPQGLSISNVLAEYFLRDLDIRFERRSDIRYYRYVDDILVIAPKSSIEEVSLDIQSELQLLGLQTHRLGASGDDGKSKIGSFGSDGLQYLGYDFKKGRSRGRIVSVKSANIRKHEASIARVFTRYKYRIDASESTRDPEFYTQRAARACQWWLNLMITGCIFDGARRGWLYYYSQINDYSTLNSFDNLIGKFIRKHGLPESFKPKSHRQAHRAITQPNVRRKNYIPNFDLYDRNQQEIVIQINRDVDRSWLASKSDEEITQLFRSCVSKAVSELDRDVGSLS